MNYFPGNAQDRGNRKEQQDAFAFSNPADKSFLSHAGLLALVSDGMGGLSNGHQASSAAVRAFLNAYEQKRPDEAIPAAMRRGLEAALWAVEGVNRSSAEQGGATLVAAVAHGNLLYWLSVGDSRVYLIRRGRLAQLNRDHTYREDLLDQVALDRLGLAEAMSNAEGEHLTSYLGMASSPEVDFNVKPIFLEADDQVILCTDGVYRAVSENDFVGAFAGRNPSTSCDTLKALVLGRGVQQQDNFTVAAFRCVDTAAPLASPRATFRSKFAVVAALTVFCANLFAANLAWNALRNKMDGQRPGIEKEQKEVGPGPGGVGRRKDAVSPTPKALDPSANDDGNDNGAPPDRVPNAEVKDPDAKSADIKRIEPKPTEAKPPEAKTAKPSGDGHAVAPSRSTKISEKTTKGESHSRPRSTNH
jgi:protein phosphatase